MPLELGHLIAPVVHEQLPSDTEEVEHAMAAAWGKKRREPNCFRLNTITANLGVWA